MREKERAVLEWVRVALSGDGLGSRVRLIGRETRGLVVRQGTTRHGARGSVAHPEYEVDDLVDPEECVVRGFPHKGELEWRDRHRVEHRKDDDEVPALHGLAVRVDETELHAIEPPLRTHRKHSAVVMTVCVRIGTCAQRRS